MIKVLFKKQMREVFSWIYQDKKTGKNRSKKGLFAFVLIYLVLFGFLGYIFYQVADMLCKPLVAFDMAWLYFALMGLIAVALGVFGSVFNTFATLYQAKDNELLLSMPVPPSAILIARLFGVYAMGLMYELIVMIPALISYFMTGTVSVIGIIFSILIPFVLSLFILSLSCILGWVVAAISSKMKNKSIVTVILSLAFIAAYYYVYGQAYSVIQKIVEAPQQTAKMVKSVLYPFYHMGLAAEGNISSMLIFTAIFVALLGVVYYVLSRSFIKIATTNKGAAKKVYKEKAFRLGSANGALLRREAMRFVGSPSYMLNCGLGIVLMVIAGVLILIKADWINDALAIFGEQMDDILALLLCAAVCMAVSMNDISAPSVSLEGKNIWIAQSFPVTPWQVLSAKLNLHLILTIIPSLFLTVCSLIVFNLKLEFVILIPVVVILYVLFMAELGLFLNLKMPNINWTDENVPVKQGLPVVISLLGGWVMVGALGALYFAIHEHIEPMNYLVCIALVLLLLCIIMLRWIQTKGAKIFSEL